LGKSVQRKINCIIISSADLWFAEVHVAHLWVKASMYVWVSNSITHILSVSLYVYVQTNGARGEVQSYSSEKCKFMILELQNFMNLKIVLHLLFLFSLPSSD
jgi:hypothetical protein